MIINHKKILGLFWACFWSCSCLFVSRELATVVGGVLCSWGSARRFHAGHKYKLKNLWNPSWKVLRMFNICIYFIVYICFVFIRNPASTLYFINTKQMYFYVQICMYRSKCYDILYYNCKLKLWTFKAGSKNIYGLFYKIHFIHTFN